MNRFKKIKIVAVLALCLSYLFLSSYKVMAVELTENVEFLGVLNVTPSFTPVAGNCYTQGNYVNNTSGSPCNTKTSFSFNSSTGVNEDYIFVFQFNVYEYRDREPLNSHINNTPYVEAWRVGQYWAAQPQFMGYSIEQVSEGGTLVYEYFKLTGTGTVNTTDRWDIWNRINLQNEEFLSAGTTVQVWAKKSVGGAGGDYTQIINEIRSTNAWLSQVNQNIQEVRQAILDSQGAVNNINNTIQNSIDETQQASDEGTTGANQGQADTQTASANIFGAIGMVVDAFNTSPRANCTLRMNLGNINFGDVDFCSGKPSSWQIMLGGAMSIVLVYVIYRIAKNVFGIFLSAMAFAQGNGKGNKNG